MAEVSGNGRCGAGPVIADRSTPTLLQHVIAELLLFGCQFVLAVLHLDDQPKTGPAPDRQDVVPEPRTHAHRFQDGAGDGRALASVWDVIKPAQFLDAALV